MQFILTEAKVSRKENEEIREGRFYKPKKERIAKRKKGELDWIIPDSELSSDESEKENSFYRAMANKGLISDEVSSKVVEELLLKRKQQEEQENQDDSSSPSPSPPASPPPPAPTPPTNRRKRKTTTLKVISSDENDANEDVFSMVAKEPKKKKNKNNLDAYVNVEEAAFIAPISLDEPMKDDEGNEIQEDIPCGLCGTKLKAGYSAASEKLYLMCPNSETCRTPWAKFEDVPGMHALIRATVLNKYKYPNAPRRCEEHNEICALQWARNTANRDLHNKFFWVCGVKKDKGTRCSYILSATEPDAKEAKNQAIEYYRELKNQKEKDKEARQRAKYNYLNAKLDLPRVSGIFAYRTPKQAAEDRKREYRR